MLLRERQAWSRGLTGAALLLVAVLSWWLLVRSAAVMSAMSGSGVLLHAAIAMMQPADTVPYLVATVLMWMVMMSAMMTPAILPVVMLFQRLDRRRAESAPGGSGAGGDGVVFASGYLLVWLGFSVVATAVQWALHRAALLHAHALAAGPVLAGILLVLAGAYQLTPYKSACLAHCQTPVAFLLGSWEDGRSGALRMGMRHGLYCLGCCWALMLLMFAGGVMSLTAMVVLTAFILAERLLPAGPWAAKLPGVALVLWGALTLAYAAP